MKILKIIGISALLLLTACQSKFFNKKDSLKPISSTSLDGTEDFDISKYQIGDEQLSDQIYFFGFDRSDLAPEDTEALNRVAVVMQAHPNLKARIEGHTDDLGSSEYNIALGWRRAQSVSDLLEREGVAQDQISIVSYGKENPLVIGTSDEARSKNRRAFISFSE